jgi:hypothetical protein
MKAYQSAVHWYTKCNFNKVKMETVLCWPVQQQPHQPPLQPIWNACPMDRTHSVWKLIKGLNCSLYVLSKTI